MITIEKLFRQDVLKAIEDWDTYTKLMNQDDFDSFEDYKAWSDGIRRCKKTNIDCLCYIYKRIGVTEDVTRKVIAELKRRRIIMIEEDEDFEEHMTESQFRHEVLKSIDDCRNEINSKNKEDFDSIKDYAEWLWDCVRTMSIYITMLRSI